MSKRMVSVRCDGGECGDAWRLGRRCDGDWMVRVWRAHGACPVGAWWVAGGKVDGFVGATGATHGCGLCVAVDSL